MTNSDFITKALRMLGVTAEGETASAEQGDDGLFLINSLVSTLLGDGIDLGLPPQGSTTDTLPVPQEYVGGFTALLAIVAQPFYPAKQVPGVVAAMAADGRQRMLRDATLRNMQTAKLWNMPRGEGQYYPARILTG